MPRAALALFLCACSQVPVEPVAVPASVSPPPASVPAPPRQALEKWEMKVLRVAPNEAFATTLFRVGLSGSEASSVLAALAPEVDFRKVRAGDQVRSSRRASDLRVVEYRAAGGREHLVTVKDGVWGASQRTVTERLEVAVVDLAIQSSLYESTLRAGEDPELAVEVADVFAWDVDFYKDVRQGDRLRVVVEKYRSPHRLIRYGRILGARYDGQLVGSKRYLRYTLADGETSYFDDQGNSARKAFLKSPLKYVRITSRFGGRRHPLKGFVHNHTGVDFAAAVGTPVWSVADGTVTKVVRDDPSAGRYLFVRHANGIETGYLHLSSFAPGLRAGVRVRQKQVIAYTGNTGASTGPHLHFAMKRGGRHVNPLNQQFPRAAPMPAAELKSFLEHTADVANVLNAPLLASL